MALGIELGECKANAHLLRRGHHCAAPQPRRVAFSKQVSILQLPFRNVENSSPALVAQKQNDLRWWWVPGSWFRATISLSMLRFRWRVGILASCSPGRCLKDPEEGPLSSCVLCGFPQSAALCNKWGLLSSPTRSWEVLCGQGWRPQAGARLLCMASLSGDILAPLCPLLGSRGGGEEGRMLVCFWDS